MQFWTKYTAFIIVTYAFYVNEVNGQFGYNAMPPAMQGRQWGLDSIGDTIRRTTQCLFGCVKAFLKEPDVCKELFPCTWGCITRNEQQRPQLYVMAARSVNLYRAPNANIRPQFSLDVIFKFLNCLRGCIGNINDIDSFTVALYCSINDCVCGKRDQILRDFYGY